MKLIPIQVQCYAGFKAEETPRRFLWDEQSLEVRDVLDRWYQGRPDPEWPLSDYFKVLAEDGHAYLLKHDQESDQWYLVRRW